MSFNEHGNIELAPTTTKGTGPFVVVFDSGAQLSQSVTSSGRFWVQMLQIEMNCSAVPVYLDL